jgi:hypothetical protein
MTPPEEAAALYRLPPGEFIAARDDLASRLREDGDEDGARAVKRLRKPTITAWALDQLSVGDPEGVRLLLASGAELRAAQQATLSSPRNAARLRSATESRKQAIGRLLAVATGALEEAGSGAHVDEIGAGLQAASVDAEAGERLLAGTLERAPLPEAGLGSVFGLQAIAGDAEPSPSHGTRAAARPASGGGIATAEVAKLTKDLDNAVRRLEEDRSAVATAEKRLETAETRLAGARTQLETATVKVRESEEGRKRAERALRRAKDRLDP